MLKLGSLGTGIFLILAGVFGSMGAVTIGGGWQYFAGSVYAILFGIIMLIVEIKDKVLIISALYHIVESEIKFLTLQTGKGIFYLGIGILVFFIGPDSENGWGLNNVSAIVLAVVGALHAFKVLREVAPLGDEVAAGSSDGELAWPPVESNYTRPLQFGTGPSAG